MLQRNASTLPKSLVRPTIAGVNALYVGKTINRCSVHHYHRSDDGTRNDHGFINPDEYLKRLAAAQGIDVLNLIKTKEELEEDIGQQQEQQTQMELLKQAVSRSLGDGSEKNPEGIESLQDAGDELSEADQDAAQGGGEREPKTEEQRQEDKQVGVMKLQEVCTTYRS